MYLAKNFFFGKNKKNLTQVIGQSPFFRKTNVCSNILEFWEFLHKNYIFWIVLNHFGNFCKLQVGNFDFEQIVQGLNCILNRATTLLLKR